jgi:hypothetical protein
MNLHMTRKDFWGKFIKPTSYCTNTQFHRSVVISTVVLFNFCEDLFYLRTNSVCDEFVVNETKVLDRCQISNY